MNQSLTKLYQQFRSKGGMSANQALRSARILESWNQLSGEWVRLRAKPEEERYFDVYGCPDAYTDIHGRRVSAKQAEKEMGELIERGGCWCCVSEYFDGKTWRLADSVGMCAGYDNVLSPFENWYIVDLMESALDKAKEYIDNIARRFKNN